MEFLNFGSKARKKNNKKSVKTKPKKLKKKTLKSKNISKKKSQTLKKSKSKKITIKVKPKKKNATHKTKHINHNSRKQKNKRAQLKRTNLKIVKKKIKKQVNKRKLVNKKIKVAKKEKIINDKKKKLKKQKIIEDKKRKDAIKNKIKNTKILKKKQIKVEKRKIKKNKSKQKNTHSIKKKKTNKHKKTTVKSKVKKQTIKLEPKKKNKFWNNFLNFSNKKPKNRSTSNPNNNNNNKVLVQKKREKKPSNQNIISSNQTLEQQPKTETKNSKEIIRTPHKKSYDNGNRKANVNKSNNRIAKLVTQLKKDIKNKETRKNNKQQNHPSKREFVNTGIKGFDALFDEGHGIPASTSVLVEGGPGSGKTLFCLTTLYNLCREGKKCLYMSFEEPEERLLGHMENFGWDGRELIKKGLLRIKRFDAIDVSRSIEALLSSAKKELLIDVDPVLFPDDFKADFVVIDSLTSIASAFSGEDSRFRVYMEQLFRYLEKNAITNFLIREVSSPSHIGTTFKEQGEAVSFLSDGIIIIYNIIYDTGNRISGIEILKMRGTSFKKKIVELKIIDKKGVEVNPNRVISRLGKNFKFT
jgi:KaiC/GvpD/RAD55 family RecA-like ATPase